MDASVGEDLAVDRVQIGNRQEWADVEDVVEPPADDWEDDPGVAHVSEHRHVEDVHAPDHYAHPAGDDHPLVTPSLHLQEPDRGRDPHGEHREDQTHFEGFLAWTCRTAEPQLVVVPEVAGV